MSLCHTFHSIIFCLTSVTTRFVFDHAFWITLLLTPAVFGPSLATRILILDSVSVWTACVFSTTLWIILVVPVCLFTEPLAGLSFSNCHTSIITVCWK
ncbi:hypothetical protein COCON_G00012440 [Conger conger]|uniref:Uncharacterized protein n=1 Tax=Conger conger TaxID=82655 RepID=A0A9Q1I954_CONCO|nr:hypothetical protein COCON_G00012440 [Conger conger]